jgi:probable FeS assembly SUF system protein SufT
LAATAEEVEKAVWEQLRTCYDPEIPVNIVDLGLVYSCQVQPLDAGGYRVEIRFTLTAPGCGMGDWLAHDIRRKVESVPGVKEADVQVVFDPPWHHDMMSDAAKLELGWF